MSRVGTERDHRGPASLMRRPHVYERSVPRARRTPHPQPLPDAAAAAQDIARILPAMIQDAEDAGLTILADHLSMALRSATAHKP